MKDNYMIFVLIAVMLTPLFPVLLKSKCPSCRKRKLEHLETTNEQVNGKSNFITTYLCHHCEARFERKRSGPLKQVASVKEPVSTVTEPGSAGVSPASTPNTDLIASK